MRATQEQYGADDSGVKRTKMIFWFVRSLAIIFFISGLILNIIKPNIFGYLQNRRDQKLDAYTWVKSWSILINTAYLVVLTAQQLMILLFYYRLDQRSKHRSKRENRYSMQTMSQYDMSSESEFGPEGYDKLTIFDTHGVD